MRVEHRNVHNKWTKWLTDGTDANDNGGGELKSCWRSVVCSCPPAGQLAETTRLTLQLSTTSTATDKMSPSLVGIGVGETWHFATLFFASCCCRWKWHILFEKFYAASAEGEGEEGEEKHIQFPHPFPCASKTNLDSRRQRWLMNCSLFSSSSNLVVCVLGKIIRLCESRQQPREKLRKQNMAGLFGRREGVETNCLQLIVQFLTSLTNKRNRRFVIIL